MGRLNDKVCALMAVAVMTSAGCMHAASVQPTPHAKLQQRPPPRVRAEPCIADELGTLTLPWKVEKKCTDENTACRALCWDGDPNACFNRAIAIEDTPAMKSEAVALFKHACQLGLATGCTNWAATEWTESADMPSWRCLYRVFEKTCAVKDPYGCGMMGRLLVEEGKTPADAARAYTILEHACDQLEGFPCHMLAWYTELGKFHVADKTRIPALMKRACEGHDELACGKHKTVDETLLPTRPRPGDD